MTQGDLWTFWVWASNQEAVELYAHGPLWDKPQHRTNWHSVTRTGLRPTDQSQNCKQAQHWTMRERTAGRGRGVSDNQKKQVNMKTRNSKDHPKELKNDSDAEPQQWGETEEAAELWRLQETSARHPNNNRGGRESNSDYKTTWSPEQHPARRQQWEKWGVKGRKQKRNQRYTNRTDDSSQPIILQGCNSHTHHQPRFSQNTAQHRLPSRNRDNTESQLPSEGNKCAARFDQRTGHEEFKYLTLTMHTEQHGP